MAGKRISELASFKKPGVERVDKVVKMNREICLAKLIPEQSI